MRGDWTLDELRAGLDGSPYSIPSAGDQSATQMLDQLRRVTAEVTTARHNLHKNYRARLSNSRRSREIHESNRVEHLGPDYLADTHRILRSKQADDIKEAINRFTLIRSLDADQRTLDVLGLHGAKMFADQLLESPSAHLAETDVRDIHGLLGGRELHRGAHRTRVRDLGRKPERRTGSSPEESPPAREKDGQNSTA